jgi:hypothetical protein
VIDKKSFLRLSALSKFDFCDEDEGRFIQDLNAIIGFVGKVGEFGGVYDDTADLHRAIAWSDAYYGDGSSVLRMYVATGKPVLRQNIGVTHDAHATPVEAYDDGEFIWIVNDLNLYSLCMVHKMHIGELRTEYVGCFSKDLTFINWLKKEVGITLENMINANDIECIHYFSKRMCAIKDLNGCFFHEASFATLPNFIEFIEKENSIINSTLSHKQNEVLASMTCNADGTAGNKIFDYVKNEVSGVV